MHRSKRRRRASTKRRHTATWFIVMIVMLGVGYLLTAGVAGKWMADNVIAPIFEAFSSDSVSESPTTTSTSGSETQQKVKFSEKTIYCVQVGVFSNQENAKEMADSLKPRGAAGYTFAYQDGVRVLIAAYSSEEDAKTVCTQLKGDGLDCTVFAMTRDPLELTITAKENSIPDIQKIFDIYDEAIVGCMEVSNKLDANEISDDQGSAEIGLICDKLKSYVEKLRESEYADKNKVLSQMISMLDKGTVALDAAVDGSENTLSARLRYAGIEFCDASITFVNEVKNGLETQQ